MHCTHVDRFYSYLDYCQIYARTTAGCLHPQCWAATRIIHSAYSQAQVQEAF